MSEAMEHSFYLMGFMAMAMMVLLILAFVPAFIYTGPAEWMESPVTRMFGHVCHQQLDRMFQVGSSFPAVCSRCTGIYMGIMLGLWGVAGSMMRNNTGILPKSPVVKFIIVVTFFIGIDILAQWINLWEGSNGQRAILGLIWGVSVVSIFVTRNK